MPLDPDAAWRALERVGKRLGAKPRDAARGILRFGIAQLGHALRLVTVRRGLDPRDFAFIAYGGAGPLHAGPLARELGVSRTVIPPAPGTFSAFGMLLSELRSDAVRTHLGPLDVTALAPLFDELEKEARADLEEPSPETRVERFAELRYAGQEHALEVPLPPGPVDDGAMERLRNDFDDRSEEAYAFSLSVPVEMVAARVSVSAPAASVRWDVPRSGHGRTFAPRTVDFDEHGGEQQATVVERSAVPRGVALQGPCIVQEEASTTLVLPGQSVVVDDLGNLVITEGRA
jgi:N-methylhydantoinase A